MYFFLPFIRLATFALLFLSLVLFSCQNGILSIFRTSALPGNADFVAGKWDPFMDPRLELILVPRDPTPVTEEELFDT